MRIVHVAAAAAFQRLVEAAERAARLVRERAGAAFDAAVAACIADHAGEILPLDEQEAWEETLARDPRPPRMLTGEEVDRALTAIGDFADLISPDPVGHSTGVAELAATAARRCRIDAAGTRTLRRAALVHDVGRVAIGISTRAAATLLAMEHRLVALGKLPVAQPAGRS